VAFMATPILLKQSIGPLVAFMSRILARHCRNVNH
jgi:hypothetical protein